MSAREWNVGDPEPADHPPVVDADGVTWIYSDMGGDGDYPTWNRNHIERGGGVGLVYGPLFYEWPDVVELYGPVREATEIEQSDVVLRLGRAL